MSRKFESSADFFSRAASWLYRNSIRRVIPVEQPVRLAGVDTFRDRKYGDRFFAGKYCHDFLVDVPDYEAALVKGLNMFVKPGMTIVVVGTGLGVTAVVAAKLTGPGGKVICYEGSQINVGFAREAFRRNGVADYVTVHHAIVGPAIGVYHNDNSAPSVALEDLPYCDVLELDCEGSEKQIISNLPYRPGHILVETHGVHGAPTVEIDGLLRQQGYVTTDLGLAEPHAAESCMRGDIRVLAAELRAPSRPGGARSP